MTVSAQQFQARRRPWPAGVKCFDGVEGPIFRLDVDGVHHVVRDGDWIVTGPDGRKRVSDGADPDGGAA